MAGRDSQVVHPPAVPIETDHRSSYQFNADRTHKKQLRLFSELACNVSVRIVPRARKTALLPQGDNRRFIDRLKGSDLHVADDAHRLRSAGRGFMRVRCDAKFDGSLPATVRSGHTADILVRVGRRRCEQARRIAQVKLSPEFVPTQAHGQALGVGGEVEDAEGGLLLERIAEAAAMLIE